MMRRPYIDPAEAPWLQTLGLPGSGSGLRASDSERERAAERLRQHHAEGRLTTEEFEERAERAYAAKTRGDLDDLFGDLPRLRVPDDERRPRRLSLRPVAIVAALVTLAVVSSAHGLWLIWPLAFFVFFRFALFRFAHPGYRWRSRRWPEPW